MNMIELQGDLCEWARGDQNILAIGLVGSYAHGKENAASDVDLVVVADDASLLLDDVSWIGRFGMVEKMEPENYGLVQSLRCAIHDGTELEFGITTAEWCTPPIDPATLSVIRDEMRVVFDPQRKLASAIEWVNSYR